MYNINTIYNTYIYIYDINTYTISLAVHTISLCYYIFMNSFPCHYIYCIPLYNICGYCYVQLRCWRLKRFIMSFFNPKTFCTHCLCFHIYISLVVTTRSWMATWKTSLLWCLLFVNSADDLFLEWNASATIRSSPVCQATVFIVFQYFTDICGYNYGQTTVLLKVKDT